MLLHSIIYLCMIQLCNNCLLFHQVEPMTRTYELEINVRGGYYVIIDLLDWNPDTTQEVVTIFDARKSSINEDLTRRWVIEEDLVDFPICSSGTYVTVRWEVHGLASGRFTFVARTRKYTFYLHDDNNIIT